MKIEPVLTKKQNYRLWQGGAYGNKLRAWRTVEEWCESGFAGSVVLRVLGSIIGGRPCLYNLAPDEVDEVVESWVAEGISRDNIMVNEAAPGQGVILQGEYRNDITVLGDEVSWGHFHYSRAKAQMRDALREAPELATSLRSDLLIRLAMTPSSYDDWLLLLANYPGHVLEVSIYDRCLGDVPGRNALVWEARLY
jgi:hypothetical protein